MYGVRGVSKNFPGLLLLFAACFEDEAKEPEAAGVWGKEYRGRFRGEERRSDELVSTDTWSVILRFLIILSWSRWCGSETLTELSRQNQIHKQKSRGRDNAFD